LPEPAPFRGDLAEAPEGTRAIFLAAGGMRIRVALTPPGGRGSVLLFPGRTEYAEKYGRVMSRLAASGFGVVTIDWRGQGLSTRPGGSTALGHVGAFAEYQLDIAAVLLAADVQALPRPRLLFAHSMGGCIGLRALVSGLDVKAAVFSAPMWGLALTPATRLFARAVSAAGTSLGLGQRHAPQGDATAYVLKQGFEGNVLTSDAEHYAWMQRHLREEPGLALGGPSLGWLDAAFREMAALARARPPALPVLGFLGGDEAVVAPEAVRAGFARLPAGRLVGLDGARHEIWMERPAIRERVWAETDAFLAGLGL
jgi:lysophospholipase